ncbi:MAG: ATP-binding cassette domain-containing protein [Thermomicrobiales bacterium]|nr:ATP-binding cassette domain-containing protein [Thermomicrobiales bacterium]
MTTGHDTLSTMPLAIQLDDVSVWVANGPTILDRLTWHVGPGQRWALLGPNGSGKSTTLSLAGAVRHPSRGRASVLGSQFGKTDIPRLRESIGYVESGAQSLDWLTGEEVVLTGIGSTLRPLWWKYTDADRLRAREMLDLLGCGDLAEREIKTCSQGERGRIRIARALVTQPQLLLLDEPAVGLDLAAREALIAALDRLAAERPAMTSVIVSHHLEELPGSTSHALLLNGGRAVAEGPIAEVLTSGNLSACFGLPVVCRHDGQRWFARAEASWARSSSAPAVALAGGGHD